MSKNTPLKVNPFIADLKIGESCKFPFIPRLNIEGAVTRTAKSTYLLQVAKVLVGTYTLNEETMVKLGEDLPRNTPVGFSEDHSNFIYPIIDALGFDWEAEESRNAVKWGVKYVDPGRFGIMDCLPVHITGAVLGVTIFGARAVGALVLDVGEALSLVITYSEVDNSEKMKGTQVTTCSLMLIDRHDLKTGELVSVLEKPEGVMNLQSIAKVKLSKTFKGDQDAMLKSWE